MYNIMSFCLLRKCPDQCTLSLLQLMMLQTISLGFWYGYLRCYFMIALFRFLVSSVIRWFVYENILVSVSINFYPTALKGCWGIVFSTFHPWCLDGRSVGWVVGKGLSGLYLRNHKV